MVPVAAGDVISSSAYIQSDAAANGSVNVYIRFYDVNKVQVKEVSVIGRTLPCATPTRFTGTAQTAPAGAAYMGFRVRRGCASTVTYPYTVSGWVEFGALRFDRKGGGAELLVDGSVTASLIDSRGLTIKDSAGKVILGAGTGLASSSTAFGVAGNLLRNSDFSAYGASSGWGTLSTAGTSSFGRDYSGRQLSGGHTLYAYTTGANASEKGHFYSDLFPVKAGERYEASAYAGAMRCDVQASIDWCNASGTFLSGTTIGTCTATEAAGGTAIANYKRISLFATAPANAAQARLYLTKLNTYTGQTDSYGFFCLPYFGVAGAAQTEFSPWKPGPAGGLGNLNQITAANASTFIENAAINSAQIGSMSVGVLSTTMNGGALSGGRITMEANKLQVFDAANALRVKVGYLL
jgi:hypothetical protein